MKIKSFFLSMLSVFFAVVIFLLCKHSLESLPVFNENTSVTLPVLMYHSVLKDPQRTGKYTITPKKFEEDLIYLKNNGYETVSLKQVIKYVYHNEPLPEKPILLTFDDGNQHTHLHHRVFVKTFPAKAAFDLGKENQLSSYSR